MEKSQALKKKVDLIQNYKNILNKALDVQDIYKLIDQVNDSVKTLYPNISCRNRCFLCCQHTNIPTATSLEWENLYKQLLSESDEFKQRVIKRVEKIFSANGKDLKEIHFSLNEEKNNKNLKEISNNLSKFKGNSCIFLVQGSCSIYESRPAKCRTQGYSLMKFNESVQFQTCEPEINKLENNLKKQGSRKVLMHSWNDYEQKILNLHKNKPIISILPIWLYVHINNGNFINKVNLSPNFIELLNNI